MHGGYNVGLNIDNLNEITVNLRLSAQNTGTQHRHTTQALPSQCMNTNQHHEEITSLEWLLMDDNSSVNTKFVYKAQNAQREENNAGAVGHQLSSERETWQFRKM